MTRLKATQKCSSLVATRPWASWPSS